MREMYTCTYPDIKTLGSDFLSREYMRTQPDFQAQNMTKPWSKFIRVGKYNKKRGDSTMVDNNETYCEAASYFVVNGTGFTEGEDMGKIDVVYYVSFSSPIYGSE